jgi:epsilon-lactone hydrolase
LREQLHVKTEATTIDGVPTFIVMPEAIPPENRNRLLIHVHGGCYVSFPGESGTIEAIFMAGFGHFKVISVDYRMPPTAPYPAALDDAMTVWKAAVKMVPPTNLAIFGSSAGGALTLSMVLRAKQENLPLPAAIAPGTPMSDLTGRGDSFATNALLDNVLIAYGVSCDARAALYANGRDLKDPLLSPIYGDVHGFPPTILTTGTRDLLLSNTVRMHRKLRLAGVEAALQVFEGMAHGQYFGDPAAPESKEVFEEIAGFFDRHLGKIAALEMRRDAESCAPVGGHPSIGPVLLHELTFLRARTRLAAKWCFPSDAHPDDRIRDRSLAFSILEGAAWLRRSVIHSDVGRNSQVAGALEAGAHLRQHEERLRQIDQQRNPNNHFVR